MLINEDVVSESQMDVEAVVTELPPVRIRKIKRWPGEPSSDDRDTSNLLNDFRVHTFNVIMDRVIQSLDSRFTPRRQLYKDLAYFDPSNFKDLVAIGLPVNTLEAISNYTSTINVNDIAMELVSCYQLLCLETLPFYSRIK